MNVELNFIKNTFKYFIGFWKQFVFIMSISIIACFIYLGTLNNYYLAEASLGPSTQSTDSVIGNSQSASLSVSSIFGVGNNANSTDFDKAFNLLNSRSFISEFLTCLGDWESEKIDNKLLVEDCLKDHKFSELDNNISTQDLFSSKIKQNQNFKKFLNFYSVQKERTSNLILIKIEHISPLKAEMLIYYLINFVNEYIRSQNKLISQANIDFVKDVLLKTQNNELKEGLVLFLNKQISINTFSNVNINKTLEFTNDPISSYEKVRPSKRLTLIAFLFLGFIIFVSYRALVELIKIFN